MATDKEFREAFFRKHPDFYRDDKVNINDITRDERRDPQFRRLFGDGLLVPLGDDEGPPAAEMSFSERLSKIGSHPIANEKARIDPKEQAFLDSQRNQLQSLINDIRSGTYQVQTTSPEQRQRLLDRASSTFGTQLNQSLEQTLADASRRGGKVQGAGFGGLYEQAAAEARAKYYEDPLTSFTRDLDIQTEADLVARKRQLQDIATDLGTRLLGSGESMAQFTGNLDLGNLNSRRQFIDAMMGKNMQEEQFYNNLEEQIRQFDTTSALQADQFQYQQEQDAKAAEQAKKSGLVSGLGSLLGIAALAPMTGGGSLLGNGLGSLFPSLAGAGAATTAANTIGGIGSLAGAANSFSKILPSFASNNSIGNFSGGGSVDPFTGTVSFGAPGGNSYNSYGGYGSYGRGGMR